MKIMWKIAKAELQTLFFSPLAWLMLVVLAIFVFGTFYDMFDSTVRSIAMGDPAGHLTRMYIDRNGLYAAILGTLYCFFPLLTMGLISREYNNGSIKLLDSSPVSTWQVVAGKYVSMCLFSLLLEVILFMPVVLGIVTVENIEMKAIFTGLLGMYLLMCTYSAIGLFMSSLSKYPVVAAVGTFGVLAVLNMAGSVGQEYEFVRHITAWLTIDSRIVSFLRGIIASADVAYYVLIIAMCLVFTWFKLRSEKMTWRWWKKGAVYLGVFLVVVLLGYTTSRPALRMYADGTEDKRNTLAVPSQEIMEKVEGKVKVTTYVNILHENSRYSTPRSMSFEEALWENYLRFHPKMELEFVYYYGNTQMKNQAAKVYLPSRGLDSTATLVSRIEGIDRSQVLTVEEAQMRLGDCVDLKAEDNPVVKIVEVPGKAPEPLRLFNDMQTLPSEVEISAVFKGITEGYSQIVFYTGSGSQNLAPRNNDGYGAMFNMGPMRASFVNQGWKMREIATLAELPDDTDVLVIANPTRDMPEEEFKRFTDYIDAGGNLFIMGDSENEEVMNRLLLPTGVQLAPGYLVEPHPNNEPLPHVAVSRVLQTATEVSPLFQGWGDVCVPMRMATAIGVDTSAHDFEFIPVMASAANSWLKTERVNLLDGPLVPDASLGEQAMPYVTVAALRRVVGDREQRIAVTSDAEWLTNVGVSTSYEGLRTNPGGLATTLMSWLSYEKYPVQLSRGNVNDFTLDFEEPDLPWVYYIYVWLLPGLIAVAGFMICYYRNKQ